MVQLCLVCWQVLTVLCQTLIDFLFLKQRECLNHFLLRHWTSMFDDFNFFLDSQSWSTKKTLQQTYCNKWQNLNADEQQFEQLSNWCQCRNNCLLRNYREVWHIEVQFTRVKRFLVDFKVDRNFDNFDVNLQVVSIVSYDYLNFQVTERKVLRYFSWVFSCFVNSNLRCCFTKLKFYMNCLSDVVTRKTKQNFSTKDRNEGKNKWMFKRFRQNNVLCQKKIFLDLDDYFFED